MVLYHNDSVTDVYTTRNIIDLQHKMRLPLYRKFEHFKYLSYSNAQRPKRDYFEQTLVQVMTDAEGEKAAVLIYKFDESQHNSLYVANSSFSKLFSEAKNSWIVLTGSSENFQEHYLGMISDSRFIFLQIKYLDIIMANSSMTQELIDYCKGVLPIDGKRGTTVYFNSTVDVSRLSCKPFQNVLSDIPDEDGPYKSLNVTIQSTNLGLAIVPSKSVAKVESGYRITYNQEMRNLDNQNMLLQNYLEGYNLEYSSNCTFKDEKGEVQSCKEGLKDGEETIDYTFPLDFVTSERSVHMSFPIGKYYFVLDTQGKIYIMEFPSSLEKKQQGVLQSPMETVTRLDQKKSLGCNLSNSTFFGKMLYVNQTFYKDRYVYLFFYQCWIDGQRQLSAAEVSVFKDRICDQTKSLYNCIEILKFDQAPQIVYDVADVDLVNLTISLEALSKKNYEKYSTLISYKARAAVVCNIGISYSNLLLIYDMELTTDNELMETSQKWFANMTLLRWNSATKCGWDTFKVNHVTIIPETQMLFASIDGYGAILYHAGVNEILMKLNITEYDDLQIIEQMRESFGEMRVYSVQINLPYVVVIFSNFGMFAFSFNQSLQNEEYYLQSGQKASPGSWRIFRMPFKTEGASVVQAPYGYAMMATQLTGRKTSSVKLVALTHYSGYLSKLFRTINVVQNANCTSLSRNPYLEESLQDQLAVSLVCESRLRIVRFCLKPNIEVNLTDFAGRSTAEKTLSQGRLQFNEFTIELTGTNEYSSADGQINTVTVPIRVEYQLLLCDRTDVLTFGIVALTVITGLILFIYSRSLITKETEKREQREKYEAYAQQEQIRKSVASSRLTFIRNSYTRQEIYNQRFAFNSSDVLLQSSSTPYSSYDQQLSTLQQQPTGIQTVDGDDESTLRDNSIAKIMISSQESYQNSLMPSLHIDLQQLAAQENKKRQSSKIKAEEAYAQMSEDFEAKEEEAVLRY